MNIVRTGLLVTLTSVVAGCGWFGDDGMFRNRGSDYLESEEIPPIVVPEGMDHEALGQLYEIPRIASTAILDEDVSTPRPQPLAENMLEEQVKIQAIGEDRWILVNRSPSEVWPRVRNILNRNGIPAVNADANSGTIDTVWLQFKDDETHTHRYRFRIEPGVQLNSTEIRALHDRETKTEQGDPPSSGQDWPEASESEERERTMIDIVANALAGDISSGTVSLLAQAIGGNPKVEIVTPQVADPFISIRLDFDRSWASVAYSLARGGFTTIDQDRSSGIFYVNFTPPEEDEPGFFRRLFGGGRDDKSNVNYLVLITNGADGIEVRVTDSNQSTLERKQALRLLKIIRANLA